MLQLINEKLIVEKLIKNKKEINNDTYTKLRCYTKYLKNVENKTKTEIRNSLDEIMTDYYIGFVMADWDKTLQSIVNKYTKPQYREFKESGDIVVYKEELDFIKSIGSIGSVMDIEIEKVLFIMLLFGKVSNSKDGSLWVNAKTLDIFKMARFKYKQKSDKQAIQREKLIYDLANYKDGAVLSSITFGTSTGIKLLFGVNDGEEVMRFDNDDNLKNVIVEYLNWRNKEDYSYCHRCGKEIKLTTNNSKAKYCKNCGIEINKEKTRKRMKDVRC